MEALAGTMAESRRETILRLVFEEMEERMARKPFVPGVSPVPYSGTWAGGAEFQAAAERLLSGWFGLSDATSKYELAVAQAFGRKRKGVFVNSGSSANLVAVATLTSARTPPDKRLHRGDEVITCAAGFPTTLNPLLQYGMDVKFVDTSFPTFNPTSEMLVEAVSHNTKALVFAHTLGNPYDMKVVMDLVQDYKLRLIEDCCDAIGSTYDGRHAGSFGDLATLSTYPAHHLTTMGEGGMVVGDNPQLLKVAESFRDWGRSCFPAGTPVRTRHSNTPIEKLSVGDEVWTHAGAWKKVLATSAHDAEMLCEVRAARRPSVRTTSNHPFYVQRANGAFEWVEAGKLQVYDAPGPKNPRRGDCLVERVLPEVPATGFKWSYRTAYKLREKRLDAEPDLMRLIGYYVAEGSLAKCKKGASGYQLGNKYYKYRVDFAFNKDEVEYIADVRALMRKYFGVSTTMRTQSENGVSMHSTSRAAYEFFSAFGVGAARKQLPMEMVQWPMDLVREFLKGYWRGDGGGSAKDNGFSMHTVSPVLAEQVREMLLRAGIVASVWAREPHEHVEAVVDGQTIRAKHTLHALSLYGIHAEAFGKLVDEPFTAESKRREAWVEGAYAFYPVREVKVENVAPTTVYNLEVEGDHSYHAHGLAVHNCWCAPGVDNSCGKRFGWKLGELPEGYDHKYVYEDIGYNLKPLDIQAAFGLAQTARLPEVHAARRRNFRILSEELRGVRDLLVLPEATVGADPSWFAFPMLVREGIDRRKVVAGVEAAKVHTRMLFGGNLLRQPAYVPLKLADPGGFPNADRAMNDGFFVGVSPVVSEEMARYAGRAVASAVAEASPR